MLSTITIVLILFIHNFIFGLGLGLGLDLKKLASTSVSASRFWPRLTSLVVPRTCSNNREGTVDDSWQHQTASVGRPKSSPARLVP